MVGFQVRDLRVVWIVACWDRRRTCIAMHACICVLSRPTAARGWNRRWHPGSRACECQHGHRGQQIEGWKCVGWVSASSPICSLYRVVLQPAAQLSIILAIKPRTKSNSDRTSLKDMVVRQLHPHLGRRSKGI